MIKNLMGHSDVTKKVAKAGFATIGEITALVVIPNSIQPAMLQVSVMLIATLIWLYVVDDAVREL